jgi:hypothetical protein
MKLKLIRRKKMDLNLNEYKGRQPKWLGGGSGKVKKNKGQKTAEADYKKAMEKRKNKNKNNESLIEKYLGEEKECPEGQKY